MRISTLAAMIAAAATVAALGYLVLATAERSEDWFELAAIATAALLVGGALFSRRAPRRGKVSSIRRTAESRW